MVAQLSGPLPSAKLLPNVPLGASARPVDYRSCQSASLDSLGDHRHPDLLVETAPRGIVGVNFQLDARDTAGAERPEQV